MRNPTASDTAQPDEIEADIKRVFLVGAHADIHSRLAANAFEVMSYEDDMAFVAADHHDRVGCLLVMEFGSSQSASRLLDHAASAANRLAVVVLVEGEQVRLAVQALRAGAHDVLEKPVAAETILRTIDEALADLKARPAFVPTLGRLRALKALAGLTRLQHEILDLIVDGQSNKTIASKMGVSQRTIDNHRAAIMKRLRVSSASAMIQMAIAGR